MKAKALSTFRTKLRLSDSGVVLVGFGQIIEADEEHLRALARNRLVELIGEGDEDEPQPKAKPKVKAKPDGKAKSGATAKTGKTAPAAGGE